MTSSSNELSPENRALVEEWRAIAGYEGEYEVSNLGRVRSRPRRRNNGGGREYTVPGGILATSEQSAGYRVVGLRRGETSRLPCRVHRLVAEAFIPNPEGRPHVNHIDHDRANNVVWNLEWCTPAENLAHMTASGRRAAPWAGKRGPRAILSDEQVRSIRAATGSQQRIATRFGISKRSVQRVRSGETYAHVR